MRDWSELAPEAQCVLLGGTTGDLLHDLLISWAPTLSWSARIADVPRLARAVVDLASAALIQVVAADGPGAEQSVLTVDEVADVVGDTANWWTDEGPRAIVEVNTTEEGDAIVSAVPGDRLCDFRNRDEVHTGFDVVVTAGHHSQQCPPAVAPTSSAGFRAKKSTGFSVKPA